MSFQYTVDVRNTTGLLVRRIGIYERFSDAQQFANSSKKDWTGYKISVKIKVAN